MSPGAGAGKGGGSGGQSWRRRGLRSAPHPPLTWAQYWDLAAATRSFNTGWDWETRGVTAWMTAVNLEGGFKPETEAGEEPHETLENTQKTLRKHSENHSSTLHCLAPKLTFPPCLAYLPCVFFLRLSCPDRTKTTGKAAS